jgi:hypothetical protein
LQTIEAYIADKDQPPYDIGFHIEKVAEGQRGLTIKESGDNAFNPYGGEIKIVDDNVAPSAAASVAADQTPLPSQLLQPHDAQYAVPGEDLSTVGKP